ncbi:MAG: hypothetical protein JNM79_01790 [Burkholderiales bacterium]|nr:hypothetical protein [Burkholderiales bacterium]
MAKPTEPSPEDFKRLLEEIEEGRAFILRAYRDNPELLKVADSEVRRLFDSNAGSDAS